MISAALAHLVFISGLSGSVSNQKKCRSFGLSHKQINQLPSNLLRIRGGIDHTYLDLDEIDGNSNMDLKGDDQVQNFEREMRKLREEVEDELNDDLSILARKIHARKERERMLAEQQRLEEVEARKKVEEEAVKLKAEKDKDKVEVDEREEKEEVAEGQAESAISQEPLSEEISLEEQKGDEDLLEMEVMDELEEFSESETSESDMLSDAVSAVLSEEAREAYDASSPDENARSVFVETEDEYFDVLLLSSDESHFLVGGTDEPDEEVIMRMEPVSSSDIDISSDTEVFEIRPKKRRKVAEDIAYSDVAEDMVTDIKDSGVSSNDTAIVKDFGPSVDIEQNEEDAAQPREDIVEESDTTSTEVALIVQQQIHGLKNEMLTQAALVAFSVTLIVSCCISLCSLVLVKFILKELIVPRLKDL